MPITNEAELLRAVATASGLLQEIQDYVGAESNAAAKVRFPRGFIRTADHFRARLRFIDDRNARDNIAYSLILSDVYRWITNRTDLFGTAREMILKSGVVLAGSICETIAVKYTDDTIGRTCRFKVRCNRMVTAQQLSSHLRDELHWLWDARSAIHIWDVNFREYERYTLADYNRAIQCMRSLVNELQAHWAANENG